MTYEWDVPSLSLTNLCKVFSSLGINAINYRLSLLNPGTHEDINIDRKILFTVSLGYMAAKCFASCNVVVTPYVTWKTNPSMLNSSIYELTKNLKSN